MKKLFIIFLISFIGISPAVAQNPTSLWKCRDSLSTLQDSASQYPSLKSSYEHIDAINGHLKNIVSVIPFPAIRIEVLVVTGSKAEAVLRIQKHLEKNDYDVVALDSSEIQPGSLQALLPQHTKFFSDQIVSSCIDELDQANDPKIRYTRSLVIQVYCEIALAHLAYTMKGYRNEKGGFSPIDGLLIVHNPIDKNHFEKLLRIFDAEGKILLP